MSCFHCDGKGFLKDGSRCYLCKGEGWLEVLGAGEVDPNVYSHVPTTDANAPGYDPEKVQGFAWGLGVERIAMLKHGIPDLRLYYENDLRFLEQFSMRVPLPWLREYCDPPLDVRAIEERLTMTGTKVEAIHHHGVPSHGWVRRRARAQRRAAPGRRPAEGVHGRPRRAVCRETCRTLPAADVEHRPATIVCGAPNVAAGQTVAVARPGAVMPDGTKLKQAKLRGVVSEGMILSESELEIGSGGDRSGGRSSLPVDDADRSTRSSRPGTPLAEVLAIAMDVLELEITPNRPDCLGVYGVARELHAATGAPLATRPGARTPARRGRCPASR